MPTYEYACSACGIVEAFQSMREDPLTICPTCKKRKVHRIVSLGSGVIFKGSGFWETDYNRPAQEEKAKRAAPKDEGPAKKDDAKPAETTPKAETASKAEPLSKAEPKPATKAEPKKTPPAK